VVPCNPKIL